MPGNEVFPILQSCTRLASSEQIYDVQFYPYSIAEDDQVFACITETSTFICRPKLHADPPFEILKLIKDDLEGASFNCMVWTRHPTTGDPLLCIAGHKPKSIKILDVANDQTFQTLPGHGKGINNLAISPLSTSLLASCSEDETIRLWNLEAEYAEQPCVALFGGAGHRSPILAIHFHPNGKWLLSGGIDTAVCLWAVPSLKDLAKGAQREHHPKPIVVFYPHFFSQEVHHNYVDSLAFYGDFIFSRAATLQNNRDKSNEILLWQIDGFDSSKPPPANLPIPKPGEWTRSSFPHGKGLIGFQRVMTFSMPSTDRFYHRFGLLTSPGMRPILAMGNTMSKYFFWDLQRLEEGMDPRDEPKVKKGRGRKPKGVVGYTDSPYRLDEMRRSESVASGTPAMSISDASSTAPAPDRVFTLDDQFAPLEANFTRIANTKLSEARHFGTSQMAWSPDGTWLIGVGDFGMMCFFHSDKSVNGASASTNGAR